MDSAVRRPGLTPQQRAALETREVSVALAAGAGCGKTFVLTERFLSHLEPSAHGRVAVDLAEIVAITFTERAAREMRDRIRRTAHKRLTDPSTSDPAHWLALVRRLDAARISTFHAFCANLLRAHAVEAQLDPRFAVLEEAQSATLLSRVTDDVLRELLAVRDQAVIAALAIMNIGELRGAVAPMVAQHDRLADSDWPTLEPAEIIARWQEFHRTQAVPVLVAQVTQERAFARLRQLVQSVVPPTGVMADRFAELDRLFFLLDAAGEEPTATLEGIAAAARVQGAAASKWANKDDYEAFKAAAEVVRKQIDKLKERASFDTEGAGESAVLGQQVWAIAERVATAYAERKQSLGALDFDDLLRRTSQLLATPHGDALRQQLAEHIKVLLVDEFQDTDGLQVELVKALCGEELTHGKLFFVGDHKQSIYRFRGAEPQVFHDLRDELPATGRLPLSRNFRSQPAILDFVNTLFASEFDSYEPLVADRAQVAPQPAVEFLWATAPRDAAGKAANREAQRRVEAHWIARRLRQLVDSQQPIIWRPPIEPGAAASARPVEPGDIALLFRAMTNVQVYEEALREWGFEYYLVGGRAFYAQQEIFDLLNLLQALASPADEIALAGALRSPIFALTDETLFWLTRAGDGLNAGLLRAADAAPKQLDATQAAQARRAAQTIARLRAQADRVGVAELIDRALEMTGYDAALLSEFLGERKLANLFKLVAQARSFDRAGAFTLTDFIRQLSEQVSREPHEAMAATNPESASVIRLMSIHQAKGLEFPVVVVPDIEARPGGRPPAAACDRRLGPLVKPSGTTCSTTGLDLLRIAESVADAEERTRLLYVATTRAADFLILSSGVKDIQKTDSGTWRDLVARHFDLLEGTPLDLPAEWRSPEINVIVEQPEVARQPPTDNTSTRVFEIIEQVKDLTGAAPTIPASVPPVPINRAARQVFSFTALHGQLQAVTTDQVDLPLAESASEAPLSHQGDGIIVGQLVHAALQAWTLRPERTVVDCRALIDRVESRVRDVDPASRDAAAELLRRFIGGERAQAIREAAVRHTELEFLLALPESNGHAPALVRGFIDALYQDTEGRWHLLDYKSHRVAQAGVVQTAGAYRLQVLTYAWAASEALQAQPAEVVLHFLTPGVEVAVPYDEAARAWSENELRVRIAALRAGDV